jgi:hypothetical protein
MQLACQSAAGWASLSPTPLTPALSSQLDRTFLRSKSRPPPVALHRSSSRASCCSHPTPPQPASACSTLEPRKLSVPPSSTRSSGSLRRSLSIVVPQALPRSLVPLDVSDILDNNDAWSFATPSTSTNTLILSPPRVPCSPASTSSLSIEYDPIELIVSYATQPATPTLSTPTNSCAPAPVSFPEDGDELAGV